jgi:hypothetical protein
VNTESTLKHRLSSRVKPNNKQARFGQIDGLPSPSLHYAALEFGLILSRMIRLLNLRTNLLLATSLANRKKTSQLDAATTLRDLGHRPRLPSVRNEHSRKIGR